MAGAGIVIFSKAIAESYGVIMTSFMRPVPMPPLPPPLPLSDNLGIRIPESCGVCGGKMTYVRGRFPMDDKRHVCPTCLADRMDLIREYCNPEYGRAFTSKEPSKRI